MSTTSFSDNQSWSALATKVNNSAKKNYFTTPVANVRELVETQSTHLKFIVSGDSFADIFTKRLGKTKTQHRLVDTGNAGVSKLAIRLERRL